ncbi:DNA-J related domain-containing protein [Alteromonas gilva]|uniref:DNA-J related domain-containing protein n=1 Tax=Alteromonas gilva TaxID=2987522 RepID=A0ABT5L4N6_9ALTE|nr:DNA-J related domain-containing protein [Alteromonas gilva]MDC8832006.1 DNA-J related domain-containing protein [Alteromonas gilva]
MSYYRDPVLCEALHALRPQLMEGLSEYALIKLLQQPPWCVFENVDLADSLVMFRCHFVLFNALYTLSDAWREQGIGELHIHTLKIRLLPATHSQAGITESDSLKAYYLNWDNFTTTTSSDVDALLNDFWQRITTGNPAEGDVQEARQALGFDTQEQLSAPVIKKRYRQLLQRHHPDKGGSTEVTQKISHAYRVLCNTLS